MKKSIDVIGLPLFSITQGREIGKVKQFVINPSEGTVAALVIDDGKWYLGAKLLPMSAVTALGEYAVTVDGIEKILEVNEMPEIGKLLEADIQVIGTNVLTNTGRIQGKVIEVIIDETGKLVACEIEDLEGEAFQLEAARILTYGKEVLIISDENGNALSERSIESARIPENSATPQAAVINTVKGSSTPVETKNPSVSQNETDESGKKFDDRHRKYLLGKKASRRIETDNGMVIVDQGGEITEEVLQKAKLAGKFVELSMNIQ